MKKLLLSLLTFVFLLGFGGLVTSCGNDDDELEINNDPTDTKILNFANDNKMHDDVGIRMTAENNFDTYADPWARGIASLGHVKGLSSISKEGAEKRSYTTQAAVIPGHGYIIMDRTHGAINFIAIYVVDYRYNINNEIIGCTIKTCWLEN